MKNLLTRLLYIVPLIVFTFFLIDSFSHLNKTSLLGIKWMYIISAIILIFLYQTIRNSVLGWTLVMILYGLFLYIWAYRLVVASELVAVKTTTGEYIMEWSYVLIYLLIGGVYVMFRPKKRML